MPTPAGRGVYEVLRERPLYDCFEATVSRRRDVSERTVRLPDDRVWQIAVGAAARRATARPRSASCAT